MQDSHLHLLFQTHTHWLTPLPSAFSFSCVTELTKSDLESEIFQAFSRSRGAWGLVCFGSTMLPFWGEGVPYWVWHRRLSVFKTSSFDVTHGHGTYSPSGYAPVSYTHLDVYKRQHLHFLLLWILIDIHIYIYIYNSAFNDCAHTNDPKHASGTGWDLSLIHI